MNPVIMRYVPLDNVPEHVPFPRSTPRGMESASRLLGELESTVPNRDHIPSWDEEIGVYDGEGRKLFAYHSDGHVEVIDPSRVEEAAVIFFRTVIEIAQLQGFAVSVMQE